MTLRLDHSTHLATIADLRGAASQLSEHRARIGRDVDTLLDGGWHGVAADQYAEAWLAWCRGCDDVLRALDAMADLLAAARADLVLADDASQARLDAVVARILAGPAGAAR